ncbi:MAG: hypothetical protein ACREJG_13735 [Candidatus Rokuibacteriota bacterium]
MARSTGEIQTDIAITRRLIEQQLDALERKVPRRWWTPYAVLAGGLVAGLLISRLPLLTLVGTGVKTVQTGIGVATAVTAVDRFLAEQRRTRLAA